MLKCKRYAISSKGRCKSYANALRFPKAKPKLIKSFFRGVGGGGGRNYPQFELYLEAGKNAKRTFKVHRLVATAFLPNTNKFPIVDHIDNNIDNICICNLQWTTNGTNITKDRESSMYAFRSPEGEVYTGSNVSEFARAFGLEPQRLAKLNRGAISSYRGWTSEK